MIPRLYVLASFEITGCTTGQRTGKRWNRQRREILMQSIWQTITAPPVTIPFSLMWLCVFALELIMLPERIRLARYGGYCTCTPTTTGPRRWCRDAGYGTGSHRRPSRRRGCGTRPWNTVPLRAIRTRRWQGLRIVQEHGPVRLFRHDTSRHTQSPISVGFSMVRPP